MGILCCEASIEQKAKNLYEILQDDLKPKISSNDKDIPMVITNVLSFSSVMIYQFCLAFKEMEDEEKVKNMTIKKPKGGADPNDQL